MSKSNKGMSLHWLIIVPVILVCLLLFISTPHSHFPCFKCLSALSSKISLPHKTRTNSSRPSIRCILSLAAPHFSSGPDHFNFTSRLDLWQPATGHQTCLKNSCRAGISGCHLCQLPSISCFTLQKGGKCVMGSSWQRVSTCFSLP